MTSVRLRTRCRPSCARQRCDRIWRPARGACAIACSGGLLPRRRWQPFWSAWPSMGESLADWLSLREAADAAARSEALARAIADGLRDHAPLRLVDLATGTGSNIRYLAPRLPG